VEVHALVAKYELVKYVNVVGYSNYLKPRIRKGVLVPEEPCIRIYVVKKVPESELPKDQILPKKVVDEKGREICVDVVEIGELRKLTVYKDRYRPTPCGVSTSRLDENSAGTIGWWVIDEDLNTYMISNNHVWAKENAGEVGDPVIQPGRIDGGREDDVVGFLAGFIPISFNGGSNYVDVAWVVCDDLSKCYTSIMEVGGVSGARDPVRWETVKKVGRTTGLTTGTVSDESATLIVGYDSGSALFTDVFIVSSGTKVSGAGDSGSPIVGSDGKFLGLLFAGNDEGTVFVGCKYSRIVDALSSALQKRVDVLKVNAPPPFEVKTQYVYVSGGLLSTAVQLFYVFLPLVVFGSVINQLICERGTGLPVSRKV